MSVHLRPFVVSLRRHNAMCGMALRYWLSTLIRRKPFGSSVPRPANTRRNMFSLNQWLKTPDVDGRYQPIVRDFQAAIPEVLDALPRKYFQQPVSWMTRIFHQFDDVSLMAAQGINSIPPVDSRCLPWAKVTLFSIRLRAQSVVFPRPGRCARRVAVSGLLRTLRLAPLPRSAHDPLPELGPAEAQVVEPERGPVAAAARRARRRSTSRPGSRGGRTLHACLCHTPGTGRHTTPTHCPACRGDPNRWVASGQPDGSLRHCSRSTRQSGPPLHSALPPIRPGTRTPIVPPREAPAGGRGPSPRSGSGTLARRPSSPAPRGGLARGSGSGSGPSPLPREPGCTASRTSRSRSRSRPHAAGPRHPIVLPRDRASP